MLTDSGAVLPNSTQLRIYPSFSEIRQEYNNAPKNFRVYFSQDVYCNIPRGSLSVEGIPIVSKEIVSKFNNLENQIVFVRRQGNQAYEQCRIIQADGVLCQNLQTQRYFRAGLSDLEYVDIPEKEGTEINYVLKEEGKVALSYQIRGICWSTQYDLNILSDDCNHTFQAFTEINNETKQEYQIDRTELFSGDIRLENDAIISRFPCHRLLAQLRTRNRSRNRSITRSLSIDSSESEIDDFDNEKLTSTADTTGQVAGRYLYSIDQSFVLRPKSTYSLPFINPTIEICKYFGLTLPFTKHTTIRKLQQKYSIVSMDKYLPSGPLTIREQDRLVGTTNLPNMAIGDKHTFSAGQDLDVSLCRQIRLVTKEQHLTIYVAHLTFKNMKSIPVKFQYKEILDCNNMEFKVFAKGSDEQNAQIQITQNGIQIENPNDNHSYAILEANGGQQIYEYEIHRIRAKRNNAPRKQKGN